MARRKAFPKLESLFLVVSAAFMALFVGVVFAIYENEKKQTLAAVTEREAVHARQAAEGITDYFRIIERNLAFLASLQNVIADDRDGRLAMLASIGLAPEDVKAVTRMDASGRIIFTHPNEESIGSSIASQAHVKSLLETRLPVMSDVFDAVQGYRAVAVHYPVFDGKRFAGSIAFLLSFDTISSRFAAAIRIGKDGYAIIASGNGTVLSSPVAGQVGMGLAEVMGDGPEASALIAAAVEGRNASGTYVPPRGGAGGRRHAVIYPAMIGGSHWSVIVTVPDAESLAGLAILRTRLIAVGSALFLVWLLSLYLGARFREVAAERASLEKAHGLIAESEERYRSLFRLNPAPMLLYEKESLRILTVNESFTSHYGYTEAEAASMRLPDIYPPEQVEKIKALVPTLRGLRNLGMWKHRRKDGSVIDILVVSNDVSYQGKDCRMAVITDVTERTAAERKIAEQARLLEIAQDAIIVRDRAGRILFWNKGAERLYGWSAEEAAAGAVPYPDFSVAAATGKGPLAEFLARGEWEGETRRVAKDGRAVTTYSRWAMVRDDEGRPAARLIVDRDITEQKRLQTQFFEAQKNQSLGTLAGGIAHDFNNILAIILGYASILELGRCDAATAASYGRSIGAAVERGATLSKQILAFARKANMVMEPVDLGRLIGELVDMLSQTFPKTISFEKDVPDGTRPVMADRSQIYQILLNLSVNARDAMPSGGRIAYRLREEGWSEVRRRFTQAPEGGYVLLEVEDSGEGMPPEVQRRIFEPFFTTKEQGKGTGLGLAVVYGVVQSHRGFIEVRSAQGRGTTFSIALPAASGGDLPAQVVADGVSGGCERILLVEDEEAVAQTMGSLLREKGYDVRLAATGKEAANLFGEFDPELVVSDMGLPDMTGAALFGLMKESRPDAKVMFVSGYIDPELTERLKAAGAKGFLNKPCRIGDLLKAVRQALDGS